LIVTGVLGNETTELFGIYSFEVYSGSNFIPCEIELATSGRWPELLTIHGAKA
jgi:hypothetical protein